MKKNLKQKRKNHVPVRLARLVRLRQLGAPLWIIKTEQIALALNSRGLKNYAPGKDFSKAQTDLYVKHVKPLMKDEE